MNESTRQHSSIQTSSWRDLGASCEAAIDLSETVGQQLIGNAPASEVVTLLEKQLQLASAIRDHISRVSETVGVARERVDGEQATISEADRDTVAERLRTLLSLKDRNRRLLSSTGVKLCSPVSRSRGRARTGKSS